MASEDDSQAPGPNHHEWEAQKDHFRACYIDQKMTLKEAAQYMKEHFNFHATLRQWERKIKSWGFQKYSSREERLEQIALAGMNVYEVSQGGRRPRIRDNGHLRPDRNLRRFAKREVNRSRSRSRSSSFTNGEREQSGIIPNADGELAGMDQEFDIDDGSADFLQSLPNGMFGLNGPQVAEDTPEQPMTIPFTYDQNSLNPANTPQQPQQPQQPSQPTLSPRDALLPVSDQWSQTHVSKQLDMSDDEAFFSTFDRTMMPSQPTLQAGGDDAGMGYSLTSEQNTLGFDMAEPSLSAGNNFSPFDASSDPMFGNPPPVNFPGPEQFYEERARDGPAQQDIPQINFIPVSGPAIPFDFIDPAELATPLNDIDPDFQELGEMPEPFQDDTLQGQSLDSLGKWKDDVLTLVNHYIVNVRGVTLGSLPPSYRPEFDAKATPNLHRHSM